MTDKENSGIRQEEAIEGLKKDFGEEGLNILMEGVDALIDVTNKFKMPYYKVSEKITDSYKKGLVREKDGLIMGFEKKEENKE